jgi:hypothetical protein
VGRLSAIGTKAGDTLNDLLGGGQPPGIRLGAARAALEHMFRGHELDTLARQVAQLRAELEELRNAAGGAGA